VKQCFRQVVFASIALLRSNWIEKIQGLSHWAGMELLQNNYAKFKKP
jgi:hypothetical protein